MKLTCAILVFLGLAALACAEDAGFFVPKAFYKLDSEGHKSDVHEINPQQVNILRRLRRQISATSDASSLVFTGNGGRGHFEQHQLDFKAH